VAVRVGIDLVAVESVEASVRDHADRYLQRVYTDAEVRDCSTSAGVDSERLAARFAAKEATMKVLRIADEGVSWRAIEVRRDPSGWTDLNLTGRAADLAREAGLEGFSVSLTHEKGFASAVVIAEIGRPCR
jgi:holo-[acyl-carrier protein] synthase